MEELESIAENISSLYLGNDADFEQLLFQTFLQIPDEVQEFTRERCRFLSIGRNANAAVLSGSLALPFPLNSPEGIKWAIEQGKIEELLLNPPKLILLSEQIVDKYEPEDIMSIIAHEIAHAYLGHEPFHGGADGIEKAKEREVAACELARQWGFSGRGTDSEERAAYFTDYFTPTNAILKE